MWVSPPTSIVVTPGLPGGQERTPWGPHPIARIHRPPAPGGGEGSSPPPRAGRPSSGGTTATDLKAGEEGEPSRLSLGREINISQGTLKRKGAGGRLPPPPLPSNFHVPYPVISGVDI